MPARGVAGQKSRSLNRVGCDIYVQRPSSGVRGIPVDLDVVIAAVQVQVEEASPLAEPGSARQWQLGARARVPAAHAEHGRVLAAAHVEHDVTPRIEPQMQYLVGRAVGGLVAQIAAGIEISVLVGGIALEMPA